MASQRDRESMDVDVSSRILQAIAALEDKVEALSASERQSARSSKVPVPAVGIVQSSGVD